ncbi:hypothetical protein X956_04685 [Trueperella pyogenes TP8]|nr:hypothetical protein X956_04685 [Trueperella pyogenes TP8]
MVAVIMAATILFHANSAKVTFLAWRPLRAGG